MKNYNVKCKIFSSLIFISGLLVLASPVSAVTGIRGDIITDTIWTKEESPYVINGPVSVQENITLTIEPGVVVKFAQGVGAYISVWGGVLIAEGTALDPIYFTSIFNDTVDGDTNGDGGATAPSLFDDGVVYINQSSSPSRIQHTVFSYGADLFLNGGNIVLKQDLFHDVDSGIFGINSEISLTDSEFRDARTYALYGSASTVEADELHISAMQETFAPIIMANGSTFTMVNSHLEDGGLAAAVLAQSGSTITIQNSILDGGEKDGLWIESDATVSLQDVVIENFPENGVSVFDGALSGLRSIFRNNGSGVWFQDGPVTISQSSFIGNADYGMIYGGTGGVLADAKNNWWGDVSGPYHPLTNTAGKGDVVSYNVLFDPWLTKDPQKESSVEECCSNVVFIPGLQATRLELGDDRLWEPNNNTDVHQLYLDDEGHPLVSQIHTDGVIDEAVGFNIYKNFMAFMDGLVADNTIHEWKAFPYDWRLHLEDIITEDILLESGNTYRMKDELLRLAESSQTGKVTIIAHSNGGLIAKLLLSELVEEGKSDTVDKLILVASPQLGTPKALAGVLHGDEQTIPSKIGIVLTKRTARTLAENMPSAYALLPSKKYFSDVFADPVIEFDPDVKSIYDFQALYADGIENRQELEAFVLGDNGERTEPDHNNTDEPNVLDLDLLSEARSIQDILDSWAPPLGVKVIQIAGWGLDTIRGIRYDDCDGLLCDDLSHLDRELLLVHDGDGTVVIPSAVAMDAESYYVDLQLLNRFSEFRRNREHADIMEVDELYPLFKKLLIDSFSEHISELITTVKPNITEANKKLRFRIHSPVSLDLYDAEGNHTGLIQNPDHDSDLQGIEQQIPNSYYWEFGETKYAGVDTFATTTVVLVGEANGTFSFEIDEVLGDEVTATTSFRDIPVITGACITTDVQHVANSVVLLLDMNGDGIVDAVVEPGEGVSVEELLDILRGVVLSLEFAEKKEKQILKRIDKLEKVLEKEFKNERQEKVKTDQAFLKLERLIEKFEKKGLLSTEDVQELLHIIGQTREGMVK